MKPGEEYDRHRARERAKRRMDILRDLASTIEAIERLPAVGLVRVTIRETLEVYLPVGSLEGLLIQRRDQLEAELLKTNPEDKHDN